METTTEILPIETGIGSANKEIVFRNENGQPVTSSLLVAQKFGKRHDHVLRDIRELERNIAEICGNECKPNFGVTSQMVEQPNGGWREES
jgi:phage regulator Rha-like protein